MAFRDVRFPAIKMAPVGGPRYRTTILKTPSGFEQRNKEWDEPLYRWNVAAQSWNDEKLSDLLAFIRIAGGAADTFRFRDPSDYTCGMVRDGNGWAHDTPHQFAVADGVALEFQLTKTYTFEGETSVRIITLPVEGTVKIYRLGLELGPSAYEIDYLTGIVTFDEAYDNEDTFEWSGMFDLHARLEGDEMDFTKESVASGTWPLSIVSVREPTN